MKPSSRGHTPPPPVLFNRRASPAQSANLLQIIALHFGLPLALYKPTAYGMRRTNEPRRTTTAWLWYASPYIGSNYAEEVEI